MFKSAFSTLFPSQETSKQALISKIDQLIDRVDLLIVMIDYGPEMLDPLPHRGGSAPERYAPRPEGRERPIETERTPNVPPSESLGARRKLAANVSPASLFSYKAALKILKDTVAYDNLVGATEKVERIDIAVKAAENTRAEKVRSQSTHM